MTTLVAVCGTHGSGKTSILTELKRDATYIVDDFKVSRSVQEQMGVKSLDIVLGKVAKMMQFQELVFEAKLANDSKLLEQLPEDQIILVERSFLDIMIYSQLWMNRFPRAKSSVEHRQWLAAFCEKCIKAQAMYNGIILVHSHPDIPFEVDPNRGAAETREIFENQLIEAVGKYGKSLPRSHGKDFFGKLDLFAGDLEARVQASTRFLDGLHS